MTEQNLSTARSNALAGLDQMITNLPVEIDEDDAEVLLQGLRDNILGTRLISGDAGPSFRHAAAMVCPIYASESLANHARYMESLDPIGLRILSGSFVTDTGAVVTRVNPRKRDVIVHPAAASPIIWKAWTKIGGLSGGMSLCSGDSLDRLAATTAQVDVSDLATAWVEAAKPAMMFGMRGCSDRDTNKNVKHLRERLFSLMQPFFVAAQQQTQASLTELLDQRALDLTRNTPLPSVGMYNFLTAPPAEGAHEKYIQFRQQAVQFWKPLSAILASYAVQDGFSDRVRTAIDRGDSIPNFMEKHFKVEPRIIKSFLNAKLNLDGGRVREIDEYWIQSYSDTLRQLPSQRFPKDESELDIAREMRIAASAIERIAPLTCTKPADLWEGVLKEGWAKAALHFSTVIGGDETADPVEIARRGGRGINECIGVVYYLTDLMERHLANHPGGFPHQATAQEVMQVLLRNKTVKRIAELLPECREVIMEADAEAIRCGPQVLFQAEWTPMFAKTREMSIDDVKITELVNSAQLTEEGNSRTGMHHCVGTYAASCMQAGMRIFGFSRGQGRPTHPEERGTLCLQIDGNGLTIREDQFRAHRNGQVGNVLRQAANVMIEGMRNGTIEIDLEGYRKDRLRGFQKLNVEKSAEEGRYKALDKGAAFIMPKSCKGMSLTGFVKTPVFESELSALRKFLEPKPDPNKPEQQKMAPA